MTSFVMIPSAKMYKSMRDEIMKKKWLSKVLKEFGGGEQEEEEMCCTVKKIFQLLL